MAKEKKKDYTGGKDPLISHHVFLLPFRWEPDGGGGYQIKHFAELTEKFLRPDSGTKQAKNAPQWKRQLFTQDRIVDYNEHHYFYDYVSEVLYEKKRPKSARRADEHFIAHYEYDIAPGDGRYIIKTPDPYNKDVKRDYILEIDSVLLHLYYTGVGILSFHLNNRIRSDNQALDQSRPEDIITINQYGRRAYPNFYKIPNHTVGYQAAFAESSFEANRANGIELAYSITVSLPDDKGKERGATEDWSGGFHKQLKNEDDQFIFKMPGFLQPFLREIDEEYDIFPVLDDRMFALCWYGNTQLAKEVTGSYAEGDTAENEKGEQVPAIGTEVDYKASNWWYRYVFVDGKYITVHNKEMQADLIEKATYRRWQNYKSLYGITEYSLVLLTQNLEVLAKDNEAFLITHFQTIYTRLAELVLLQRACIQRFSDDITHISRYDASSPRQAKLSAALNRRYLRFINRIYFREVTAQQQGIEMYDLLQSQSRVNQHVNGLRDEIEKLQGYIDQRQSQLLSLLATLFVAPSLLLAAFALLQWPSCIEHKYVFSILVASVGAAISYVAFRALHWGWRVLLIILFFALLFSPQLYCWLSTYLENPL